MKFTKLFGALALSAGLAFGLCACGDKTAPAPKADAPKAVTLSIGVSPVPHADIINFVKPTLEKEGVNVKVIEFNDYVQPNLALDSKELDANFFQHKPYLDTFAKEHKLNLAVLCAVHLEPMGVYSKSVKAIGDVPEGAKVGIPNDPTNGGRALLLLQRLGLIKLNDPNNLFVTPADIVENPKNLKIIEVEAAQLPRSLDDVAMGVINCNFALGAGLNPVKDSIAIEAKDSPYANVVAIRAGEASRPEIQTLKELMNSPELRKFIEEKYQGSLLPTF